MSILSRHCIYLAFLLVFFPRAPIAGTPAYTPVDFILLNCGELSNTKDRYSRSWEADHLSRYAPANAANVSNQFPATNTSSLLDTVPYSTARVINSTFTYSFPVSSGHKFIRLYFYSDSYAAYSTSRSYFSVTANGFTLLSNFSAFLQYLSPPQNPSIKKEYIINVEGEERIALTFSPNPNSFAFINGIEIVSLPDELYFRNRPIKSVPNQLFDLQNDTSLETLYRLNVGSSNVQIRDDTGMFRYWSNDDDLYISSGDFGSTTSDFNQTIRYTLNTPPYSAPEIVYRTSRTMGNLGGRLEWLFSVDSGFFYMIRFHFCVTQFEGTGPNEKVFTINIDDKTAEIEADVIAWAGGTGIPIIRDYITWVPNDGSRGKKGLLLSLFPNNGGRPKYSSALLNGLEIFKLSDSKKSLAARNSEPLPGKFEPASREKRKTGKPSVTLRVIVGVIIGILAMIAVVSFLIFRRWRQKVREPITNLPDALGPKANSSGPGTLLLSDLCRHFSLEEIKAATCNFDDNLVIGKGGFGHVYKGFINNGATTVAVKRLHASSNQGAHEFLTEIELLSKLRHLHLVSLIGYCNDNAEMILVYDYMAHGTLRDHLYNSDNPSLMWKLRLKICLGAAKGLHYLHTGTRHAIIHRDVKSTNILLDENWVAKVSDFGLSKISPFDATNTHVSTVVKGSFGYIDPEYWQLQQLTDKSDVYSLGVVLFEVLCARPAILPSGSPEEQVNLAKWVKLCHQVGKIDEIVDSNIKDQITPECLNKYVETGIICLKSNRTKRPAMSEVVRNLEVAMQLQEGGGAADSGNSFLSEVGVVFTATESASSSKTQQSTTSGGVLELTNLSGP